jgi:hypothetical protein
MSNYICGGCICSYNSIDTKDILIGLRRKTECLCLTSSCCLALNTNDVGVGVITESGEICKLGLYVCNLGLKKPSVLCSGATHCLCLKSAGSCPFDSSYVGSPVCACCFIQLHPEIGVLKQAPSSSAISR